MAGAVAAAIDQSAFRFHEVTDFPVVRIAGRGLPHGYAQQWAAEMNTLLAQRTPFVLIFLNTVQDQIHDDRKGMMMWLRKNKAELKRLCPVMISIEPDPVIRLAKRTQGLVLSGALGLRFVVVAERGQAEALAQRALGGESVVDTGD